EIVEDRLAELAVAKRPFVVVGANEILTAAVQEREACRLDHRIDQIDREDEEGGPEEKPGPDQPLPAQVVDGGLAGDAVRREDQVEQPVGAPEIDDAARNAQNDSQNRGDDL